MGCADPSGTSGRLFEDGGETSRLLKDMSGLSCLQKSRVLWEQGFTLGSAEDFLAFVSVTRDGMGVLYYVPEDVVVLLGALQIHTFTLGFSQRKVGSMKSTLASSQVAAGF